MGRILIEKIENIRHSATMFDLAHERFAHRLGIRISQMRRESGMDQQEFARKIRLSPGYLSLIENGQRLPSILMLARIASVLEVPLFEFFVLAQ